jgi:hypothetical protein
VTVVTMLTGGRSGRSGWSALGEHTLPNPTKPPKEYARRSRTGVLSVLSRLSGRRPNVYITATSPTGLGHHEDAEVPRPREVAAFDGITTAEDSPSEAPVLRRFTKASIVFEPERRKSRKSRFL